MSIRVFVTGGTFDKHYNEIDGTLTFNESHVEHVLDRGRCKLDVKVEVLMMVDSLDMEEADRATMRAIAAAGLGRTVVLTGAMIPFAFGSSDGLFNLGSALSFVQVLPPGVYVAMNGRCFTWDNVRKNRELGVFESIRPA